MAIKIMFLIIFFAIMIFKVAANEILKKVKKTAISLDFFGLLAYCVLLKFVIFHSYLLRIQIFL